MEITRFTSHDGKSLALYTWDNVIKPKAVIKICHGMAEHSLRYQKFAEYLNKHGYFVVASDHRGHGLTAEPESLGYEEGDMFDNNVKDQITIVDHLAKKYKLPVILFGHSYGSFVTQAVMERPNDAYAYVLCGSNYIKGLAYSLCGMVANHICKNKGARQPADTIVNLSFKQYEKKFKGKNAWLSANKENVDNYNKDELCGFVCSANFYRSFMMGIAHLYDKKQYVNIDTDKPVLLIAGEDDPVGEYGKGVKKLYKFYKDKVKMKDVQCVLRKGERHEILNETKQQETFDIIIKWADVVMCNSCK